MRRNKKSLKIGDGPETRETEFDVLQRLRNKGVRKQRERGRAKHLLKLIVKDKLLHSGKVPIGVELGLLRREKRGTEVQRYGTLNEAMKM